MLDGRMMHFPLTLTHLVRRARDAFPTSEVVWRTPDLAIHRRTYREVVERAERLAAALTRLGVRRGTRVATLCWNHCAHLEAYLGIPGMGAVLHTLNLRLHPSDLGYIASHAEDEVLIVDRSLLELADSFRREVPTLKHVIVVADTDAPHPHQDYEALLASAPRGYVFPELNESEPAMLCYTSGTTGRPRGVLHDHRSQLLHAMGAASTHVLSLSNSDRVMPVVPMFHAGAWGTPYACLFVGAALVFPGPRLDAPSLLSLLQAERVTFACGVPTVWLAILAVLDAEPSRYDLSALRRMVVGGAAAPPGMIDGYRSRHSISIVHAWGMTEMGPMGSVAHASAAISARGEAAVESAIHAQGIAVPLVEMRHVDIDGNVLERDGTTMGELEVRGACVATSYVNDQAQDRFTADGWFKTGDVVTVDADAVMRVTDRSKDVVKSGGEFISSVALENALMAHPAVLEAAVFAAKHPKWDERPVAAVVFKRGHSATVEELQSYLAPQFVKFWLPEKYLFLTEIPRTSTGKFLKMKLRADHGDCLVADNQRAS